MNLITIIKEGQNIEKGLKIHKKKITKLNLIKNIKNKLYYKKPSEIKRLKKIRKEYLILKKIKNLNNIN
ncbi:MAG: 30S ribosomal protein S21 [Candidatus Shikimatogenerans bostrichidophilus]|nr:MAG: 30S ribosomal protein S21 [Candidatus Shikimatogenerans bostrichidophilus]